MRSDPAERWVRVKRLFAAALEKTSAARASFLAQACGEDLDLRNELETLLAARDQPGILDSAIRGAGSVAAAQPDRLLLLSAMGALSGARFGRFEIVDLLGRGGMGQVYRARDERLGRDVALKILAPGAHSEDHVRRFEQEARAAGSLNHPNIVDVHDIGTHEGAPYIVSELLHGATLRERLASKPLPLRKTLDYTVQLAQGLSAAHDKGVIHRDLKPENLFVTNEGRLKILDFGIAKLLPSGGMTLPEGAPSLHTGTGAVMGTVAYMSPEQVRGERVDHRSDIFAVGAILYEMLAFWPAFERETPVEIGYAILNDEPPDFPTRVPTELDRVVRRCLEKKPEERFQSAHDLAFELGKLSGSGADAAVQERFDYAAKLAQEFWVGRPLPDSWSRAQKPPSIAVLPFVNLSSDKEQEYFADGIAEEILNALTQVPGLRVVGRTSSFSFKGKGEDLRRICEKLNVGHVLEGSVRKERNRVRITAQLIDAADGYRLWSQTYDRKLTSIFAVQDDIAWAVVASLKLVLLFGKSQTFRGVDDEPRPSAVKRASASRTGAEGPVATLRRDDGEPRGRAVKRPSASGTGAEGGATTHRRTASPEAYGEYLLGRQLYNRGSAEFSQQAVVRFEKAVALDPGYAPAWAGLASALFGAAHLADHTADELEKLRKRAGEAADKAVLLGPDVPEAVSTRGWLRFAWSWNWAGAQKDLQFALTLAGDDATNHLRSGELLAAVGRLPEAIAFTQRSIELDPLEASAWIDLGQYRIALGQGQSAREALNRAQEIAPDDQLALHELALAYLLDNQPVVALTLIDQAHIGWYQLHCAALAQHALGHPKESQAALDALIARYPHIAALQVAQNYAWRADLDRAFEWLDHAYAQHDTGLWRIKHSPLFLKIHGNPRWAALLEKMNLPVD